MVSVRGRVRGGGRGAGWSDPRWRKGLPARASRLCGPRCPPAPSVVAGPVTARGFFGPEPRSLAGQLCARSPTSPQVVRGPGDDGPQGTMVTQAAGFQCGRSCGLRVPSPSFLPTGDCFPPHVFFGEWVRWGGVTFRKLCPRLAFLVNVSTSLNIRILLAFPSPRLFLESQHHHDYLCPQGYISSRPNILIFYPFPTELYDSFF